MFDNKKDFKETFERRLIDKYGRDVASSHITERYEVLGEMVRDFARMADIEFVHIDKDTTPEKLEKELFFADVAWKLR